MKENTLVILNMSDCEEYIDLPLDLKDKKLELLVSNVDQPGETLSPWEARTYLVQ